MLKLKSAFKRLLFLVSGVLMMLTVNVVISPAAEAGFEACRADPIVTLSDGTVIQMAADIETSASNVKSVVYTLHVPRGLTLVSVVHIPGPLMSKETLNFYADADRDEYLTETKVRTVLGKARVTASTSIAHALVNISKSVSGHSGKELELEFEIEEDEDDD